MKRKLLSIATLLLASAVNAQVGIGTTIPNKSAELTVLSKDKGLLIPNISLKSTTDTTTISNGNVESLLVYANVKQGDIVPGFYYWNKTRWVRLVPDVDIASEVINNFTTIVNNENVIQELEQIFNTIGGNVYYDGTKFEYTDASGTKQEINIEQIVKGNETLTTLVDNHNGTYTYTSENGAQTTINVPQSVIENFETIINNETVKNEILELITQVGGGNVYYDGTKFEYVDASGTKQEINIEQIVKGNETLTTLVDNNNGTYTYTSENGTETIINVPQSVIENFETIINNETVKNEILELITQVGGGNVYYDGTTFKYTDANGATQVINLATLVKANETITTLVKDASGNGKYSYKNEAGVVVVIDVPADVINNFEEIINQTDVQEILNQYITENGGNVNYDGTSFTYINESGATVPINLSTLIKANETITTLVNNNNGTYTYTSENGTQTVINVPQSVIENFETIINNETVKNEILELITTVGGGNVYYDGITFKYTDSNGATQVINLATLVKANETLTTLVNNNNGTYTYTSENGTQTVINVPQSVIENFETIINNETVKNEILELITTVGGGNVYYDGTTFKYTDANGATQVINLATLVKANETITTLVKDASGNGKYSYTNEAGVVVVIDVPADVINNFEEIINQTDVQEILNQYITENGGNVNYDGTSFTYINESGAIVPINLSTLIKANETLTTLVDNDYGSYTYTSENGTEVTINIPAAVVENFETIINNETVKYQLEQLINITGGNVYYDGTTLEYIDGDGNRHEVNLTNVVRNRETVTKLVDNNNGTFTYYNERGIDVAGMPIPNTGVTFNIPKIDVYDLTQVLVTGTRSTQFWSYDAMVYRGSSSTFYYTDAVYRTAFTGYFNANDKPVASKYLNIDLVVNSYINTNGNFVGNVAVDALVDVAVYVNNVLVKQFISKYYSLGGYTRGANSFSQDYSGIASFPANLVLTPTNNKLEIRVKPFSSDFQRNFGSADGSFRRGANAFNLSVETIYVQLFEK
ncbi:hypothetical protein [Myroides odoratus]|uniref:hypothetical protein n=1 Tax=Myroides odoratus TaxID=256 RepID=UPI0039B073BC